MKKSLLLASLLGLGLNHQAQTTSTFEDLSLADTSYYNGSDQPGGTTFTNGNAIFSNVYNATYSYWESGWAYSNLVDSITAGSDNLYGCRAGSGHESTTFAIGQNNAKIILKGSAAGKVVGGFYVTNSTYAALSMQFGDMFAKKFGGESGNEADWFKLTIKAYYNGNLGTDSVDFYLADYTPKDSANDYIVKDWRWVDLSSLGNVDSLIFTLSSSDVGMFGMNTPAFFCVDNFTTLDSPLNALSTISNSMSAYPNPANDIVNVNAPLGAVLKVFDVSGKLLSNTIAVEQNTQISIDDLADGVYHLQMEMLDNTEVINLVKF